MRTERLREWPAEVVPKEKGLTRKLIEHYKRAFEADPGAKFCAGEFDGITIVIARGATGEKVQHFVTDVLEGVIERKGAKP